MSLQAHQMKVLISKYNYFASGGLMIGGGLMLAVRGIKLLDLDNFICTFDQELTHACVCDALYWSITQ